MQIQQFLYNRAGSSPVAREPADFSEVQRRAGDSNKATFNDLISISTLSERLPCASRWDQQACYLC